MNQPLVSVVIPCYNYARFLPEAVASVVAQTHPEWEIVVVDDGSTDATAEIARELAAALPGRLRALHQPNSGLGAARNSGVRRSHGRYVVHLDADDMLAPTMLARCAAALEADPRAGFAYPGLQSFGTDWNTWPSVPFDAHLLAIDDYVPSQSMVRRAAWDSVGGFDTVAIQHGYEDWDFWMRLVAAGWRGVYVAAPLIYYRRHGRNMTHRVDPERDWDARAQIIHKHPAIYGPRLSAWAARRIVRRGLPSAGVQPPTPPPVVELTPASVRYPLQPFVAPQPGEVRVGRAWRMLRRVPFPLRVRLKRILRQAQLAARAAGLRP